MWGQGTSSSFYPSPPRKLIRRVARSPTSALLVGSARSSAGEHSWEISGRTSSVTPSPTPTPMSSPPLLKHGVQPFFDRDDKDYGVNQVSPHVVQAVFMAYWSYMREEVLERLSHVRGRYLAVDHTFTAAKYIADPNVKCFYTVLTENHQVMSQVACTQANDPEETRRCISEVDSRFDDDIVSVATDDCCAVETFLKSELGDHVVVTLDAFHALRRVTHTVKTSHPKFRIFCFDVSQAIMPLCASDLQAVKDAVRKYKNHVVDADGGDPRFFSDAQYYDRYKKFIRRSMRLPLQQVAELEKVRQKYAQEDDLFGDSTNAAFENVSNHCRKGCLQDPPNVEGRTDEFRMYERVGTPHSNILKLQAWRCLRGTSALESYHNQLKDFTPGTWLGGEKSQALIHMGNDAYNRASAARFGIVSDTLPDPVLPSSDRAMNRHCRENMRICGFKFRPMCGKPPKTRPLFGIAYMDETLRRRAIEQGRPLVVGGTKRKRLPAEESGGGGGQRGGRGRGRGRGGGRGRGSRSTRGRGRGSTSTTRGRGRG